MKMAEGNENQSKNLDRPLHYLRRDMGPPTSTGVSEPEVEGNILTQVTGRDRNLTEIP
jgi:hypothetical protein